MKLRGAVVDYRVGNLGSVFQALVRANAKPHLARNQADIDRADFIILPGVGEFSTAMDTLRSSGLYGPLRETIASEAKPVLGICLGMQLFAASSEEAPGSAGLGLLNGSVKRLTPNGGVVPHTGWTSVEALNGSGIDGCYYFSHSYYFESPEDQVVARTMNTHSFAACVRWKNIFGCQFHPEKSQAAGERFLEWFLNAVRDKKRFG